MFDGLWFLNRQFPLTCFRGVSPRSAVRLQTCSLCICSGKLLLGKFAPPSAVELVRIQYVNYWKGDLMSGRHCHSTVLRVQHPSSPRDRSKRMERGKKLTDVRNYACGEELLIVSPTSCLLASSNRISGGAPSQWCGPRSPASVCQSGMQRAWGDRSAGL